MTDVEWLQERHDFWCAHMESYARRTLAATAYIPPRPYLSYTFIMKKRALGTYNSMSHTCHYCLAYLVAVGRERYDETIAHEVVHAYQRCLNPGVKPRWHGELFYFLLRQVCGKRDATHRFSLTKAEKKKARMVSDFMALKQAEAKIAACEPEST
jgi:hypothetical protein